MKPITFLSHSLLLLTLLCTPLMPALALPPQKPLSTTINNELKTITNPDVTLSEVLKSTGDILESIWNYRLVVMDKHPIAVSNVVIGIVLLILGLKLSRRLSKLIGLKFVRLAHVDQSVSIALEKISYYVLLVIISFVVLDIVNVPLTAFTFIGGALAIGVGFGSQNIISNFISGLILIVERPIKVGDLVDVSGTLGRIINIGARCTHIRTGNSIDILVPNSQMLESKVINWTFTDNTVRVNISLGVSYDSPTKKVEELLLKATSQIQHILKTPEPQIFFSTFGESALNFEIYFWIELSTNIERRKIISDLNHVIYDLLRSNNITFAYPQRDIHLSSAEPLRVKLSE
jgi:potassium-dependent mechanosensitive channel